MTQADIPMSLQKSWLKYREGFRLDALTFNCAVAEHSAAQWSRRLERYCEAIEYDTFCGTTRYAVFTRKQEGDW